MKWTYLVISLFLIIYGGYFVITNFNSRGNLFISAVIALSIGGVMMLIFLVLTLIDKINSKKHKEEIKPVEENIFEEPVEELETEEEIFEPVKETPKKEEKPVVESYSSSSSSVSTSRSVKKENRVRPCYGYISELGSGPIIEINGYRIRDMRDNTYYRIEDHHVYSDYGGLMYVIEGKTIKSLSRGYLYEISSGDVYKVYGGYYASFSGGHISLYDNSKIYRYDDDLGVEFKLVIAVILFGDY